MGGREGVRAVSAKIFGSEPHVVCNGGSGEIRTHGGREPSPVFKTGALNHSATLPSTRAES